MGTTVEQTGKMYVNSPLVSSCTESLVWGSKLDNIFKYSHQFGGKTCVLLRKSGTSNWSTWEGLKTDFSSWGMQPGERFLRNHSIWCMFLIKHQIETTGYNSGVFSLSNNLSIIFMTNWFVVCSIRCQRKKTFLRGVVGVVVEGLIYYHSSWLNVTIIHSKEAFSSS